MSTPPPPRPPGPASASSTRQLLDELDALMQRMLALPVNQLDEPPAPVEQRGPRIEEQSARIADHEVGGEDAEAPAERTEPAAPAPLAPQAFTEDGGRIVIAHAPAVLPPPHRPAPPAEPPRPRFTPPDEPAVIIPPGPSPSAPAPAPPVPPPAPPAVPAPRPRRAAPPLTQPQTLAPPPGPAPAPRRRAPGWVMRPLLWSNRTFDRWTAWFGSPGRWLRGPRGRSVLGWVGLGLWATALTLALLRFLG
jgi:hypothetical protein